MNVLIHYFSLTGNTKLALDYIASKIPFVDFHFHSINNPDVPSVKNFDAVIFATYTDFWSLPKKLFDFFEDQGSVQGVPAVVFNTYGFISGRTLKDLSICAEKKGFRVILGHSLHTPENFPPMRKQGKGFDDAPNAEEKKKLDDFITILSRQFKLLQNGESVIRAKLRYGFIGSCVPRLSRKMSKKDFGFQSVITDSCIKCGKCAKVCSYSAVTLNPYPVFDQKKCMGCWACYNHCLKQAVVTKKFRGVYQYSQPGKELQVTLSID